MKVTIKQLEAKIKSLEGEAIGLRGRLTERELKIQSILDENSELRNFAKQVRHQINCVREITTMIFHSRVSLETALKSVDTKESDWNFWAKGAGSR